MYAKYLFINIYIRLLILRYHDYNYNIIVTNIIIVIHKQYSTIHIYVYNNVLYTLIYILFHIFVVLIFYIFLYNIYIRFVFFIIYLLSLAYSFKAYISFIYLLNYLPFQNEKNVKVTRYYDDLLVASYSGHNTISYIVWSEPWQISKECEDKYIYVCVYMYQDEYFIYIFLLYQVERNKLFPTLVKPY